MRNSTIYLRIAIIGCFLLLITSCGNNMKFYGSFCGKVVDTETNEPVDGVVFVAKWDTLNFTDSKHSLTRPAKIRETSSNKQGEFRLKGRGLSFFPYQPSIEIFKAGYTNIADPYYPNITPPINYKKDEIIWDGGRATVKLRKLSIEERHKRFYGISSFDIYISDEYKNERKMFDSELKKEIDEVRKYHDQINSSKNVSRPLTIIPMNQ